MRWYVCEHCEYARAILPQCCLLMLVLFFRLVTIMVYSYCARFAILTMLASMACYAYGWWHYKWNECGSQYNCRNDMDGTAEYRGKIISCVRRFMRRFIQMNTAPTLARHRFNSCENRRKSSLDMFRVRLSIANHRCAFRKRNYKITYLHKNWHGSRHKRSSQCEIGMQKCATSI